jgi:hypothetical protein
MRNKFLDPKNDQELLNYDQAEKYEGAYRASMDQKFDEGKIEGKMEAAHYIACNMLAEGMDFQRVQMFTGLTLPEIDSLIKNLKSTST